MRTFDALAVAISGTAAIYMKATDQMGATLWAVTLTAVTH